MNELLDEVQRIIDEHGYLTGQEFLDLTDNNMPLYHAYVAYWDAILIPDLEDAIQNKIKGLGG